jgi:hypothetical protein
VSSVFAAPIDEKDSCDGSGNDVGTDSSSAGNITTTIAAANSSSSAFNYLISL